MYRILYNVPLWLLCVGLIGLYTCWSYARQKLRGYAMWRMGHGLVLLFWLGVSLQIVIFGRTPGSGGVNLEPFWSYRIAFLEGSFDYFQEIYLNVLAFACLGLILPELFRVRYWVIVLLAAVLSISIEYFQLALDVGLAEFDDIFSNTLGAVLGVLANSFSEKYICAVIRVGKRWIKS